MFFSLTATGPSATDLGFVLHKHPDRLRSVDIGFGTAHVFYPEAADDGCTAALLVEVDPIRLSRRPRGLPRTNLEPYVNDRPYAASSFLSVAIGRLYGSALAGRCEQRPELVDMVRPLRVELPVVPVRGGETVLRRLFEPLGYKVTTTAIALDERVPDQGNSRYLSVILNTEATVRAVLSHLYVLLPVLDDAKHYWVGDGEIDKLLRRGEEWLPAHPENEFITRRYLRHRPHLTREALARLAEGEPDSDIDGASITADADEDATERPLSLNERRLNAVVEEVRACGARRVVDLGCGEGRLIQRLASEPALEKICGVDVSLGSLERASKRVKRELSGHRPDRIELIQGALTYLDRRLLDYDVATVIEVMEHIDPERLDVFEEVLFGHLKPGTVVVTTPNIEYNVHFEDLGTNRLRHGDHRFEWTRVEFETWASATAARHGYEVRHSGIGDEHVETGPPTQMAVFTRAAAEAVSGSPGSVEEGGVTEVSP